VTSLFQRALALTVFVLALAGGAYYLAFLHEESRPAFEPLGSRTSDVASEGLDEAPRTEDRALATSREVVTAEPTGPTVVGPGSEEAVPAASRSIKGRVIDAATGEGRRTTLQVSRSMKLVRTEHTLEDGTFSVDDLDPGTYAIGASHPGGGAGAVEGIELTGVGEPTEVVIRLTPGGTLSIRFQRTDLAHASYEVHRDSAIVAHGNLMRDVVFPVRVPAGDLEVVLLNARGEAVTGQQVSVGDGTQVAVNFE
jgi:hypothetical protein